MKLCHFQESGRTEDYHIEQGKPCSKKPNITCPCSFVEPRLKNDDDNDKNNGT
jgi:hypothetical protein